MNSTPMVTMRIVLEGIAHLSVYFFKYQFIFGVVFNRIVS